MLFSSYKRDLKATVVKNLTKLDFSGKDFATTWLHNINRIRPIV